jgi:CBS-domain-containing membrane protein
LESEPIETVVERFAKDSKLIGIFVIDESRRYKGSITRHEILQWAKNHLSEIPEDYELKNTDEIKTHAKTAKALDLVNRGSGEAYIHMDDHVTKALSLMILYNLIDMPVLNDTGEIINDLNLSELLNRILKDTETEPRRGDA